MILEISKGISKHIDPKIDSVMFTSELLHHIEEEDVVRLLEVLSGSRSESEILDFVEKYGWLPKPSSTSVDNWNTIFSKFEDKQLDYTKQGWTYDILYKLDDDNFSNRFRFRTKIDKNIRRTRLRDFQRYLQINKIKRDIAINVLDSMKGDWDYISVLNILWASCLYEMKWHTMMIAIGALKDGFEYYSTRSKELSNYIKTHEFSFENWQQYVECQNLIGYRNPPMKGFDFVKESEDLANGGEDHLYFGYTFEALISEFIPMNVKQKDQTDYESYSEYIRSGKWTRSGAAAYQKIEAEVDGIVQKIRPRKNMLPYVEKMDKIIDQSKKRVEQVNNSFIKAELGKLRIAVTGDLDTYLKMSWLLEFVNKAYNQWPGSTLEEEPNELANRSMQFLKLLAKHKGLPFDYKLFDHQPNTKEIVSILRYIFQQAREVVPPGMLNEYDEITLNVLDGFDNSWMTIHSDGDVRKIRVKGGVMSGQRITSIIGNAWNSIITGLAAKLAKNFIYDDFPHWIRGDDSAIFGNSWVGLNLVNLMFKMIGVEGSEGKYSIRSNAMEFLRIWYQDQKCTAYPSRVLPGLVQRKPWNAVPWDEFGTMRDIFSILNILKRRSANIEKVWESIVYTYSQKVNISPNILPIPIYLGGAGIGDWDGVSRVVNPPKINKNIVRPINLQIPDSMNIELEKYQFILTEEQKKEVALDQFNKIIASDDIPGMGKIFRQRWRDEIRRNRPKIVRKFSSNDMHRKFSYDIAANLIVTIDAIKDRVSLMKAYATNFGTFVKYVPQIETFNKYKRYLGVSLSQYIKQSIPDLYMAIRSKNGLMSERLNWLLGSIPINSYVSNPMLSSVITYTTAAIISETPYSKKPIQSYIASQVIDKLTATSALSMTIFML